MHLPRLLLGLGGVVGAVTGIVLTACSSGDSNAPNQGGDGGEGLPLDASSSDGAAKDAAPSKPTGSIAIFSSAFKQNATANIGFLPSPKDDPSCTVTASGGCRVALCPILPDASVQQTPIAHASAGTVSFDGGALTFNAVSAADGTYPPPQMYFNGTNPPFKGGESATLTANGGDVPAFSQSLTYPLLFLLEQPMIPDGGSAKLSVPRNQDFILGWSRGVPDADLIVQGAGANSGTSASLSCTFPSMAGAGTIPQALLTKLPASTELRIFSAGKAVSQAGDYVVISYLAGEVLTPSKSAPVILVTE